MKPNNLNGFTLGGRKEIRAAITACAIQDLPLAEDLQSRAYIDGWINPTEEIELNELETKAVMDGIADLASRRLWQAGRGHKKVARAMLDTYTSNNHEHAKQTF